MNEQLPNPPAQNYMEGTTVRDAMADILEREWQHAATIVSTWLKQDLHQLYWVGCGGSFATTLPAKWLLDRFSTLPVDRYTGWEMVNRAPARLDKHSAVALGSHSGTTEEIMLACELATARGAKTVALTQPGTPLGAQTDAALTYSSSAANLSKLLLGYLLTFEVLRQRDQMPGIHELREALIELPTAMHDVRTATQARSRELAAEFRQADQFYVLGAGLLSGLAYQYANCNLIEMQWVNAASFNAGEFRHGPLEIVQPGLSMIFLLGLDESREITERALSFSQAQGAHTMVFDLADMPGIHPWLAPFGLHLPLQWLNWYLGLERNHSVAARRYMGKVPF